MRKHVQDMADKSVQTEAIAEEKKEEIKLVCEAVVPEEKPAAVEVGPEFPESVQSRSSIKQILCSSQNRQISADYLYWRLDNDELSSKEKVDKEQQTYFSVNQK